MIMIDNDILTECDANRIVFQYHFVCEVFKRLKFIVKLT